MNLKNVKQKIKDDAQRVSEFLGLRIDRSEDSMSVNCVLKKAEKDLAISKMETTDKSTTELKMMN